MKIYALILGVTVGFFSFAASASAEVTLFAEGPSSASAGSEVAVHLKARLTEPVNAIKATVLISPDTATIQRFDDANSVIRLWLQRGTAVPGGILLEGVIPGGTGPAFTDVADLGTLWVRPGVEGALRITFGETEIYLNQPTPTLSDVRTSELVIPVTSVVVGEEPPSSAAVVSDADVRIIRESEFSDGARSVIFDIKTDRGTADVVRIRERWFGLFGSWREISSPAALSDSWGVSILEVALSDSVGGAHVASIVPVFLRVLWGVLALGVLASVRRYLKKRH